MASSPAFIAAPNNPAAQFQNADGTGFKAVLTTGASGSRVDTLVATSTDTVANTMQLALQKSGVDYVLGEVTVPASAGTNGVVKSVAVLNPVDIPGMAYTENGALYLAAGVTLRARMKTAVAGSNTVQLTGVGGDY